MFQIIFPFVEKGGIENLGSILPYGWRLAKTNKFNIFAIKTLSGDVEIGTVTYLPFHKGARISVQEENPEGENFWRAFAKAYRELDPYKIFYGVVYPAATAKEGVYELVVLSDEAVPSEADLDSVAKYGNREGAYFVKFVRGNWHPHHAVEVLSHEPIKHDGTLGPKLPGWEFKLAAK